jgi:hypothetical protein
MERHTCTAIVSTPKPETQRKLVSLTNAPALLKRFIIRAALPEEAF